MPIRDVAAMNASLDNDYGTTRGPAAADSHQLALCFADPTQADAIEDVELTGPGYARATLTPGDWAPAADGSKSLTTAAAFPTATGEWEPATHFALVGDDGVVWDCAPLADVLLVTGAGDGPLVTPTVFYDDALNTD